MLIATVLNQKSFARAKVECIDAGYNCYINQTLTKASFFIGTYSLMCLVPKP